MGTQPADMLPALSLPKWDSQRSWFAVFTRSHHEKRVAQYYAERNIEHLLPISRVMRQWSHYRKVTVELPLFPNYLFVHISRGERTRVVEVPGALSLVGQRSIPAPLLDIEIESLRAEPETTALRATSLHGGWVEGAYKKRSPGRPGGHRSAYEEPLPGGTNALSHYEELYCRGGRCRP